MSLINGNQAALLELVLRPVKNNENGLEIDFPTSKSDNHLDEILKSVYYILENQSKLIESALDLLDSGESSGKRIIQYRDTSSCRTFWKLNHRYSKDKDYFCLSNYCNCSSFSQLARGSSNSSGTLLCKHLLAVKIAVALDYLEKTELSTSQFVDVLSSVYPLS
jgi:predicted nucleic acid-binding Zn finger protein